jgi:large subunit ribosomal protein L6e
MVNTVVSKNSRSATYAKKVVYKRKRWTTTAEKKAAEKTADAGKARRFYPTDEERRRFKTTGAGKSYRGACKVKEGIVPGSILILVAGRHRGKRVVFLKQLESGLLLVTGPFKINGVPMRRVNQKYVIPTNTKLDFNVAVPDRVDDEYFSRVELNAHEGQNEGEIFQTKKASYQASSERKEDQKAVDAAIVAAAKKVPYMVNYLSANFALRNGQDPAKMIF